MTPAQVIPLIRILTEAMQSIAEIAKEDPEVWAEVKNDFMNAKKAFMEEPNEIDT